MRKQKLNSTRIKTATQETINERNEILDEKRKELDTIVASTEKEEKGCKKIS